MLNMGTISFNCDGSSVSGSEGDSGVVSVADKDNQEIFFILIFMGIKQSFFGDNILQGSVHHIIDLHSNSFSCSNLWPDFLHNFCVF